MNKEQFPQNSCILNIRNNVVNMVFQIRRKYFLHAKDILLVFNLLLYKARRHSICQITQLTLSFIYYDTS